MPVNLILFSHESCWDIEIIYWNHMSRCDDNFMVEVGEFGIIKRKNCKLLVWFVNFLIFCLFVPCMNVHECMSDKVCLIF
jgi:hypothetical protein